MIRRALPFLALATVLAAPFAWAAVTTNSRPDRYACTASKTSDTLVRTAFGRVYTVAAGRRGDYAYEKVYACNTATGRTFFLGTDKAGLSDDTDPAFLQRILSPSVTSQAVAWVRQTVDPSTDAVTVELREISLKTGRTLRRVDLRSPFTSVVQADNGYLAYIEPNARGSCDPTCEVHLYNPKGNRVIDSGADIEPDSLARDPGPYVGASTTFGSVPRFYWIKGGSARTALFRD